MRAPVVKLQHVAWRDGRPRFIPGPRLRALGFKGEDLKDAQGDWLDLRAAKAVMQRKQAEIDAAAAAAKAKQKARKTAEQTTHAAAVKKTRGDMASLSVGDLFKQFFATKKFRDAGKPGCLAKTTKADYQSKADTIMKFDPEIWTSPAAALDRSIVKGLHEDIWEDRGLPMANGVVAVLRAAYSHAQDAHKWLDNPCLRLKLPPVKPRQRVASPAEIAALLQAADEAGDPEIGDAVVLALFTGQRQGDILALEERAVEDGKIRFIQSKTGARVRVRALPALVSRLNAARMRRLTLQMKLQFERSNKLVATTVVVDSNTAAAFEPSSFRHRYARVRARAAKQTPSVATLLFLDLRDTAVTWLANAGCTEAEIAAISGHSLATVGQILKHYLQLNEQQADNAMDKLENWMDLRGIKL